MKKNFKRITAAAMAFALLGTGTLATKAISPTTTNTLVASANSGEYWVYCPEESASMQEQFGKPYKVYKQYYCGHFSGVVMTTLYGKALISW